MPQTPDLNAERLAKLKELFPDLFTDEGNLNEVELKKLVDPKSVNETERYEFRWFGKSNAKRKAFTPTTATLNYDPARSVNPEQSENLIIEGENLKVLKLLLCSYREQIKCIYIDPPYNTGKDFVYSDNYTEDRLPYWKQTDVVDEYGVKIDTNADTDGRYHSNWMNMMFSRLLVARQLLRKDGVIFISIDDNEVHNLRRICNEVFGEENFVSTLVWEKRYSPQNAVKWFSESHDFVLVYAKNKLEWYPNLLERSDEMNDRYRNPDNDPRGVWKPADATAQGGHGTKSQFYVLTAPNGKQHTLPNGRCWVYTEPVFNQMIADNRIWFGANGNNVPAVKRFLSEVKQGIACQTIWKYFDVGHNQEAKQEINDLFPESSVFDTPKPVRLLKRILQLSTNPDDLILDFFAGSGTTGQAVMELNEADGGNRKFILVQLPEFTDENSEVYKAGYKRISDITIERNKRVVNRIIEEKRAAHPNLFENHGGKDALKNLGFKVFKLEKSYFPRTEWSPNPEATEAENVQSLKDYIAAKEAQLRIDFDRDKLLTEILLKEGFKLNYTVEPYEAEKANEILHVSDGEQEALVCLDTAITNETVEHLKTHKDLKFICLERGLDTTKKWNLANCLGEKFKAF